MEIGELGALLIGAVIGILVTAIACWLNGRSVRREPTAIEPERRMHVPVANPTPGWEPHNQPGFVASTTSNAPASDPNDNASLEGSSAAQLSPAAASNTILVSDTATSSLQLSVLNTQRERDILTQETQDLRRQIRALDNELQRVEQQGVQANARLVAEQQRVLAEQQRATVSEAGLVKARREIDEIREFVLQLGATKNDEDIIDLRKR